MTSQTKESIKDLVAAFVAIVAFGALGCALGFALGVLLFGTPEQFRKASAKERVQAASSVVFDSDKDGALPLASSVTLSLPRANEAMLDVYQVADTSASVVLVVGDRDHANLHTTVGEIRDAIAAWREGVCE